MAGRMGWYQYVSDNGTTYKIRQDQTNAVAVGAAAEPVPSTHARYPGTWKPRYIRVERMSDPNGDGTGGRLMTRNIPIGDLTEAVWLGTDNEITLFSYDDQTALDEVGGSAQPWQVRGRFGEDRPDR